MWTTCSRYLQNYVDDLFAGAWEKREVSPLPVNIPHASHSQGYRQLLLSLQVKNEFVLSLLFKNACPTHLTITIAV